MAPAAMVVKQSTFVERVDVVVLVLTKKSLGFLTTSSAYLTKCNYKLYIYYTDITYAVQISMAMAQTIFIVRPQGSCETGVNTKWAALYTRWTSQSP